jgi:hypothetical protein
MPTHAGGFWDEGRGTRTANERLADLWARGVAAGKANQAIVIPAKYRPKPVKPVKASRPLPTRRPAPGGGERRGLGDRRFGGGGGWGRR